jgi:hypothetical protein
VAIQLSKAATIKIQGTAVAMTGEACTYDGNESYQITNAAKRALDPAAAIKAYDDGVEVAAAGYSVDYAHGILHFDPTPSGPVTVDASYLPLLSIAEASAIDVEYGYESVDASRLGDATDRTLPSRAKCSLTLKDWHAEEEDLDGGANTRTLGGSVGTTVFLEVWDGVRKLRGWFFLESRGKSISLTEAIGRTTQARGVVQTCNGRSEQALFSWR